MTNRLRDASLLLAVMASPAAAQRSDIRVEQQNAESGPASEQVSASQIAPSAPQPVAQLSTAAEREGGVAQLTADGDVATSGAQLTSGPRTAREPESLSRPSEGRTGAVARVEGDDRCADADPANRPAVCDRPIEARSAEFARPRTPAFSPEQRLLVDQRLRDAGLGSRVANLGRTTPDASVDPDAIEGQALASVALDRAGAGGRDAEANAAAGADPLGSLPEASAALIQVLLENAGVQQPPR